jgi:hypothetical protein
MGWYRVVKTIKGHRYIYEQRTWREGKHVRTESRYIGPADGPALSGAGEPRRRRPRNPPEVNTTAPSERPAPTEQVLSPTIVEEAFETLLMPPTAGRAAWSWIRPWAVGREGENLVRTVEAIEHVIEQLGPTLTHDEKQAFYRGRDDLVNIPPKQSFIEFPGETATQTYYATLLHELGHWTGHRRRLNRHSIIDTLFEEYYALEELVAEATAMILLRHFDLWPEDTYRHAFYFQHYLNSIDNRDNAIAYAKEEAELAAKFILGVNTTKST